MSNRKKPKIVLALEGVVPAGEPLDTSVPFNKDHAVLLEGAVNNRARQNARLSLAETQILELAEAANFNLLSGQPLTKQQAWIEDYLRGRNKKVAEVEAREAEELKRAIAERNQRRERIEAERRAQWEEERREGAVRLEEAKRLALEAATHEHADLIASYSDMPVVQEVIAVHAPVISGHSGWSHDPIVVEIGCSGCVCDVTGEDDYGEYDCYAEWTLFGECKTLAPIRAHRPTPEEK